MSADLQILTKTYDLILWTLGHTAKFPRSHRFSLGTRMEQHLYSLLDDLIEAKYTRDKADILRRAALRLEQIRYQFRMAKDLRIIALNSHHYAIQCLDDVGRQLGGWRKKVSPHEATRKPV
jgi:hypothetical protein